MSDETNEIQVHDRILLRIKLEDHGGATIRYRETVSYGNDQDFEREPEVPSKAPAHPDLVKLFRPLAVHLHQSAEWDAPSTQFTARSITLTPPAEKDKPTTCTITGFRTLKSKRVVNFNSPPLKLGSAGEKYEGIVELANLVEDITREAFAYVDGKHGEPAQIKMDLGEEGKPKGKKKKAAAEQ